MAVINTRPLQGSVLRDFSAASAGNLLDAVVVNSSGNVVLADADASAASAIDAVGVVVAIQDESVSDTSFVSGQRVTVCVFGPVAGYSGLTPAAVQYCDHTTDGDLTETASTTSGDFNKVVGRALAANVLFVTAINTITPTAVA